MRGFTLAELLVVVALAAILMMFGAQIFLMNNRFYENQTQEILSVNSTREAADRINEYGRAASSFVNSYVYSSVTYNTGAQTVIFRLPSINSSGGVISGVFDYVIVSVDPGNSSRLVLIVDPGAGSVRRARNLQLTDKLVAINFTYDNTDLALAKKVTYDFTVMYPGRSAASEQVHGAVNFRNK